MGPDPPSVNRPVVVVGGASELPGKAPKLNGGGLVAASAVGLISNLNGAAGGMEVFAGAELVRDGA